MDEPVVKKGRGGPRPGFGGKQPGAGRPKKPKNLVTGLDTTSPKAFLLAIMADETLDIKERIGAAKAVAAMERAVAKPLGKKEQAKVDAAEAAGGGPFGAGAAPKGPTLVRKAA